MSWQDEMIPMIRVMIGDVSETQSYSDSRLIQTTVVAAQMAQTEAKTAFIQDYTISIPGSSILPDPTTPNRDDPFINLVSLKTACFINNAEYRVASTRSIALRDGNSSIDLRGILDGTKGAAQSFCQAYEDAKTSYLLGNSSVGNAIVSPYRIMSGGNSGYGGCHLRNNFN